MGSRPSAVIRGLISVSASRGIDSKSAQCRAVFRAIDCGASDARRSHLLASIAPTREEISPHLRAAHHRERNRRRHAIADTIFAHSKIGRPASAAVPNVLDVLTFTGHRSFLLSVHWEVEITRTSGT